MAIWYGGVVTKHAQIQTLLVSVALDGPAPDQSLLLCFV